jgi:hypothetical protein
MYKIKEDKIKELKDGRNLRNISEIIGITEQYLSMIFNGKKCTLIIAWSLVMLKENVLISDRRKAELLDYYFEKQ